MHLRLWWTIMSSGLVCSPTLKWVSVTLVWLQHTHTFMGLFAAFGDGCLSSAVLLGSSRVFQYCHDSMMFRFELACARKSEHWKFVYERTLTWMHACICKCLKVDSHDSVRESAWFPQKAQARHVHTWTQAVSRDAKRLDFHLHGTRCKVQRVLFYPKQARTKDATQATIDKNCLNRSYPGWWFLLGWSGLSSLNCTQCDKLLGYDQRTWSWNLYVFAVLNKLSKQRGNVLNHAKKWEIPGLAPRPS